MRCVNGSAIVVYPSLMYRWSTAAPGPEEVVLRHDEALTCMLRSTHCHENIATVLSMYYVSRLRYREIAAALAIPLGTVKTQIRRAKQLLRAGLKAIDVSTPRVTILPHRLDKIVDAGA